MLLLLLLLGVGALGESRDTETEADARLDAAAKALAEGRAAEAETLYRAAIAAEPLLADSYAGLADALEALGRAPEAAATLAVAGAGLLRASDPATAAGYLERAVRLDPRSAEAHAGLGQALLGLSAFDRAARHLDRARELGDRRPEVALYLAAALWETGRTDESETLYRKTLAAGGPGGMLARESLGALLLWQGRFADAATLLREAVARRPDSPTVRFDLARALEGAGDVPAAIDAYLAFVASAPRHAHARYRVALLLDRRGEREAAEAHMAAFRELHAAEQERTRAEGLARARSNHGWALLREGRAREALAHFGGLPETVDVLRGRAAALSLLGRPGDAAGLLERALALEPERQDLRRALAAARLAATPSR